MTYRYVVNLQSSTNDFVYYYWLVNNDTRAANYSSAAVVAYIGQSPFSYQAPNSNYWNDNNGNTGYNLNYGYITVGPDGVVWALGPEGGYIPVSEAGTITHFYKGIYVTTITSLAFYSGSGNMIQPGSYVEIYNVTQGG